MFNIQEELKKLPDKPGVYIMKDKDDNIVTLQEVLENNEKNIEDEVEDNA